MASAEDRAALGECLKQARVDSTLIAYLGTAGIETLDDFANYVRRGRYEEDLMALQARGPEALRAIEPGQPGMLAQARLRAAYLLAVDLLKRAAGRSHDDMVEDPNAPLPQPVRDQLAHAWQGFYHLQLPVEL